MTPLLYKAIKFAEEKHKGQTRKVSSEPYVIHPITVSYLVSSYKKSKHIEDLLVAAVLHDTLEDTDTNFVELATEFTPLVASLVLELTSDDNEISKLGKNEYMKKKLLGISNYALVLKLVDRLHNISDNPSKKYKKDTIELINHLENNRMLTPTQKNIVNDILDKLETV